MPDLLGVTNPVPGHDTGGPRITPPMPNDTSIQNIIDPTRIVRPDQRTDRQDTGDATLRYESNFMTFLQRLQNTADLSEIYMRLVQGGIQISSGIDTGFAEEISQFLELLQMDEGHLLNFLKEQMQAGTRFSGPLFQLLRAAYNSTQSQSVKNNILQFVQRYNNFISTERLEGKMIRTISDMSESLPGKWGSKLLELNGQLANGAAAGDREGNVELLQKNLFPLLSKYVTLTHDHGRARNLLSLLTLDVTRYENGSEEGLVQAFRRLNADGVLPTQLSKLSDEEILQLLRQSVPKAQVEGDSFADRLSTITHKALQGSAGPEAQDAFRNIMSSILINESVYMPLNHLMIPIQWDDHAVFSEMWVDPDADSGKQNNGGGGGGGKTTRILIKLDVADLGAFDVLLQVKDDTAALRVTCPKSVSAFSDEVSKELSGILERNGYHSEGVYVAERKRALTLTEVFPKLLEKAGGINVKI